MKFLPQEKYNFYTHVMQRFKERELVLHFACIKRHDFLNKLSSCRCILFGWSLLLPACYCTVFNTVYTRKGKIILT